MGASSICGCSNRPQMTEVNLTAEQITNLKMARLSSLTKHESVVYNDDLKPSKSKPQLRLLYKPSETDLVLGDNKLDLNLMLKIIKIQKKWRKFKSDSDCKKKSKKDNIKESQIFVVKTNSSIKSTQIKLKTKTSQASTSHKRNKYKGGKNFQDMKEGFGIVKWEDNSKYIGYFKRDKANGYGKLRHSDGFYYKGEFEDDKANGFGIFTGLKGESFEGEWKDDTQNGFGRECLINSHEFEGVYVNGKKNGIGKYVWRNGCIYEGEWKDNNLNGFGIYYFNEGKVYKGQFQDNMMHGYGEFQWKDGKQYKGYYLCDKKEGFGIHYWPSPVRLFIGFWKEGKQDGIGKYVKNNSVKYGQWIKGERIRYFDTFGDAMEALPGVYEKYISYFKIDVNELMESLNRE